MVPESLLQAVIDAQPEWMWIVDRANRLTAVNESMCRALGRASSEMLGQRPELFVQVAPSPDPGYRTEDDWLMATGQEVRGTERLGRLPDGRYVWWQRWKRPLRDPATGEVTGLVGITRDITEQRELERAALEAAEHERWRLGSELHDGAGGTLAGIDMMVSALQTRLEREGRDTRELQQIKQLLRSALQDLKGIARGLAPVDLEQAGLYEGLRRLLEQVESAHEVDCELSGDATPQALLGPGDTTHLYRIAQEAITNALQHGAARHIRVRLEQDRHRVEIRVEDDGCGFDPARSHRGLGLRLMHYRARLLAGRLQITPRDGGGTCVVCSVPTRAAIAPVQRNFGAT